MEIKAELLNPTKEQRTKFISINNWQNGYEIKEYETIEHKKEEIINPETGEKEIIEYDITTKHLEAWGYTEEEIEKQKREHIKSLTCTKRVFALMLQELGVDYLTQLKPLIESNPQAQLEWELCVELLRENPMLDLMARQLEITSEQLDKLFQYANGEITKEEFVPNEEIVEEEFMPDEGV